MSGLRMSDGTALWLIIYLWTHSKKLITAHLSTLIYPSLVCTQGFFSVPRQYICGHLPT